jgi:hypothetical protein
MNRTNRVRPVLEALEDRALLSSTPLLPPTPVFVVSPTSYSTQLALHGTVAGIWSQPPARRDVGSVQALKGTGSVLPLSYVQASGQLRLPGFIRNGKITGTLKLTVRQGTLNLQLTAPVPASTPGKITSLGYKITSGTGKYRGMTGSGVVVLTETTAGVRPGPKAPHAFSLIF